MVKKIAVMTVVSVLALAPQVFAFGGGGGGRGGSPVSGTFQGGSNGPISGTLNGSTFSGMCNAGDCSGTFQPGNGTFAVRLGTPEPFAGLIVGLGLLGARYLRRR